MNVSLYGVLSIARDALVAQTAGIDAVGQNVSNASNPGYVRRAPILETLALGDQAGGVQFVGTHRMFDRFAFGRVTDELGQNGSAQARSKGLGAVQDIVAPSSGSLGDSVSAFFQAVQALTAAPTDPSARAQLLARTTQVTSTFSDTATRLEAQRAEMLAQAQGISGEVNDRLSKIASLSAQIETAQAMGQPASDLRDQRDKLVRELADRVGARSIEDDKGHFTLFAAGMALVDGGTASSMNVTLDQTGALKIEVVRPGGSTTDVTSRIDQGSLGGVREVRDVELPKTQSELDQYAYDFARAVNAVHMAGYGLDGVGGRGLFTQPAQVSGAARAMSVDATIVGHPERLAASESANALPGGNGAAVALAQLAAQPLNGNGTPSDRYASLVGNVGAAKASADSDADLRQGTLAHAEALRESGAGVSLDEEMVDLTRYQRGFEASLKILQTADGLLDNLLKSIP